MDFSYIHKILYLKYWALKNQTPLIIQFSSADYFQIISIYCKYYSFPTFFLIF